MLLLLLLARPALAQSTGCSPSASITQYLVPWYCSQINQAVQSIWYQWEPVAFAAVMFAFLIAATIFMLGTAMRNEKMKSFGVGELYEATATSLIAILFLFLSAVLFGVLPAFITGPLNPYSVTLTNMTSTMQATQGVIKSIYDVVMISSFYSSINIQVYIAEVTKAAAGSGENIAGYGTASLLQPVSRLFNPLASAITLFFIIPGQTVSGLLMDGLLALNAEFYFVLFFMYTAIPVFLIPGIILRAIFPLRSVGGLLMAVAFAFFLIMPILFAAAYTLSNQGVVQALQSASAQITANGQGTGAENNAASPTSPLVTQVQAVQSDLGGFFLEVLFYPVLILALTYTSMNILADFIGGATQTTGKMRLL